MTVVPIQLLNAVGITRTHNTVGDWLKFNEALKDETNRVKFEEALHKMDQPFYRFFSNYGTGIGETMEEIVAKRFKDIVPKRIPKIGKDGQPLKSTIKNPIYERYNKENSKKHSNYDWLADAENPVSVEVKVIRATSSKPKHDSKLYEIPSLLEERALTFAERGKIGNQSFQQTKYHYFDYLLGVVVYIDQVDFYIVPSSDIKNGKLKITNQHAGAIMADGSTNEGHLALKRIEQYKVKTVYTEEELLSEDSVLNYITK